MHQRSRLSTTQRQALDFLMSRQSPWPLILPLPSAEELATAFDVAMRAPDHLGLKPWRFIVVRGEALFRLGEVFARAASARDASDGGRAARAQASTAPMLIAVGATLSYAHDVPEIEQMLAAGAATMNLLNALHVMGFGAYWTTGPNAYDAGVREALGLGDVADQLLGFVYVGTPVDAPQVRERPGGAAFWREWNGTEPPPTSATSPQATDRAA